jgi:hypothetical protein
MRFRWGNDWRTELSRPRLAAVRRHAGALGPAIDALDRFRVLPDELTALPMPVHVITAGSSPDVVDMIGRMLARTIPQGTYRQIGKITLTAPFGSDAMVEVMRPLIASMAL